MVIQAGKEILKRRFPQLHQKWVNYFDNPHKQYIARLLSRKDRIVYDSDKIFDKLQKKFSAHPEYGYDVYHAWLRGVERARRLVKEFEIIQNGKKKIVEVGCGDGMTGFVLSTYGHDVSLLDMDDWRDQRSKDMQFIKCSLTEKIPLADESFDFIYSFNTFEHILEPKKALDELLRICKRDGIVYLDFDPLYASPWGLHAFGALNMPYPQFLFSENFYLKKIKEIGNFDIGRVMEGLQPLNKWRVHQYDELFQGTNAELVSYRKYKDFLYLKVIKEFSKAFSGLHLTYEDVTVFALRVTLRKKCV